MPLRSAMKSMLAGGASLAKQTAKGLEILAAEEARWSDVCDDAAVAGKAQGEVGEHAVQIRVTEEAAAEFLAQRRRECHPSIGRIAHDQAESFALGCLLQRVAHPHDGGEARPRLTAKVAQCHVEENLRHPGREGVELEPLQPILDALERIGRAAVLQTVHHSLGYRRQECAAATGGVEDADGTPIDPGFGRHVEQPLAKRRRCVVRAELRAGLGGDHGRVQHADEVARDRHIQ